MIRDIVQKSEKVLTIKANKIYLPGEKLLCKQIIDDLIDTMQDQLCMYNFRKGIGLAAPQIGIPKRIFVVKFPQETFKVFINPEIISFSKDKDVQYEGCLSFFEYRGKVERSLGITIRYIDELFDTKTETYRFGKARLLQHEYDHIKGILYTDRMTIDQELITYREYTRSKKTEWKYHCEE